MHYWGIIHTGDNTYWELNKYQILEKISNIYVEFLQILTVLNLAFNKHKDNLNINICSEAKNHQNYKFLHKLDTKFSCQINHALLKL